jgi:hypothetical protein
MSKPPSDSNPPKSRIEELTISLQRRVGRTPRVPEPVVYEFTTDLALLHQYFRIREIMYRKIHKTDKFVGKQDWHDKIGHILIARRGRLCIGGCRLIMRDGEEDFLLPMEDSEFKVRDAFPHLPLTKLRHGEISRFAVLDDDEEYMDIMLSLSRLIIEKCIVADLAYVFIKSPGIAMARNWRKIISTYCGQKEVTICDSIKMHNDPDYPEIEWQVIKTVLPAAKTTALFQEPAAHDSFVMPEELLVH